MSPTYPINERQRFAEEQAMVIVLSYPRLVLVLAPDLVLIADDIEYHDVIHSQRC